MTATAAAAPTAWLTELVALAPCAGARRWAGNFSDIQSAWDACERGDWMLWYLASCDVDRRRLVLAACACARLALPHVRAGETRPLQAIETAERWARGEAEVTLPDVRAAAAAAAYAAYATAYATANATAAATANAAANAAAYAAAARRQTQQACAAIVRRHFPRVALPSTRPVGHKALP